MDKDSLFLIATNDTEFNRPPETFRDVQVWDNPMANLRCLTMMDKVSLFLITDTEFNRPLRIFIEVRHDDFTHSESQ
jgi:hypothetical protein